MRWILLVFLGSCSYGILSTFVKSAYAGGFTVQEVTTSQILIGALMLWLVALCLPGKKAVPLRSWGRLLAVGLPLGGTGIFYYNALQYVPASIGIILLFQFAWIGVLIEAIIERAWPKKEKLLALLFLGIGTVLAGGVLEEGIHSLHPLGIVYGLLSAITYTLFILFSGRVALEVETWKRSAIMATGSVILVLLVYTPAPLFSGALAHGLLIWVLLLGLFGIVIPTAFFNYGMPKIGVGLGSILGAAELPTAVFMSSFVLKEHVSLVQWIGVIVILTGIAVPELAVKVRKKPGISGA